MSDQMDVIILGRKLGTASGWAGDALSPSFYDFVPVEKASDLVVSEGGVLNIDLGKGVFDAYDENGEIVESHDLVPILAKIEPEK